MIKLIRPSLKHKEDALTFIKECLDSEIYDGNKNVPGDNGLSKTSYEAWLNKLKIAHLEAKLPIGMVASSTYFSIDTNTNQIVGIINIRHKLNQALLEYGGHIGYTIRPKYRQQGYGTKQLQLGLNKAYQLGITKVLITCDLNNLASSKTITNCQGVLENIVKIGEKTISRYWIDNQK